MDKQSVLLNILHRLNPSQATHLRIFCYDDADFRHVYDQLTKETTANQFFNWLIDFATRHGLFARLVNWLDKQNFITETEIFAMSKPIYVAVIAMTQQQAIELTNKTIFDPNSHQLAAWSDFWNELQNNYLHFFPATGPLTQQGLITQYGRVKPEDWCPLLVDGNKTIDDLIKEVLNHRQITNPHPPQYLSTELLLLHENDYERARIAKKILNTECGIIIIDAISLYHPHIKEAIDRLYGAGGHENISVIIVPPLPYNNLRLNKFLEHEFYNRGVLFDNFSYFKNIEILHHQFGVGDIRHIKQWLFTILKWNPAQNIPKGYLSGSHVGGVETVGVASHMFNTK